MQSKLINNNACVAVQRKKKLKYMGDSTQICHNDEIGRYLNSLNRKS